MSAQEAEHLGEVVSINSSIMLLLVDADAAPKWHGTANGPVEFEPAGSDWEKAFQALYPNTEDAPNGRVFARATGAEVEVAVLALSDTGPGRVDVFAVGDRIVLVEGYYEEEARPALRTFVASLPRAATEVARIALPSGWLALIPAPSRGEAFAETSRDARATAVALDDEQGLLVKLAPGEYVVAREPSIKESWGEATCAVLTKAR